MSGLGINRLYAYGADGERTLIRDVNLNPVVYTIDLRDLDQKVIRELTYTPSAPAGQAWSWTKDDVYRGGVLLASIGANEGTRHYTLDHLGTPRLVTDRCGAQYALFNYFPFGDEITGGSQDGTERMRFTGHERDLGMLDRTNDDLDYMHARYYKPVTAERFLSVDPVGGDPHSPQSWDRYSYVANNPMRIADPAGRSENDYNDSAAPSTGGGMNPASRAMEAGQNAAGRGRTQNATEQGKTTPPPTNPDGSPAEPPIPPPPGKDGKPNDWVRVPGRGDRPNKWVPRDSVPSPKGGQPGASWDPKAGHWDVDDRNKHQTHRLPDGTLVDHDNNPVLVSSPGGVVKLFREHPFAVGVGVVVVGGTAILLIGGAAAPALAFAF